MTEEVRGIQEEAISLGGQTASLKAEGGGVGHSILEPPKGILLF